MIVNNTGYLTIEQVKSMKENGDIFGIYLTHKDTLVLVKNTTDDSLQLFSVQEDRLPHKIVEGKRIVSCNLVFNSETDDIEKLDVSKFNNGTQIMSYEDFAEFFYRIK